jgi:long-chain fatty acid transport protein
MMVHRVTRLLLSSIALAVPGALCAQGFGLNEIGSCAIARGFATTASPCRDASTIYWNPAAATWVNGWNLTAGAAAIGIYGRFTRDTSGKAYDANEPISVVPHAFLNYHAPNSKIALGVGFYVPYGLTSKWNSDFPGRFSAQKAQLQTFYIQPNIAWQITPTWSIGGGPVIGHSTVELIQALDLSTAPTPLGVSFGAAGIARGTQFGSLQVKGSATAYGAQVGIAGRVGSSWSVGARYLTALTFKYDNADAVFTQTPTNLLIGSTLPGIPAGTPVDALVASQFATGGALVNQKASTSIKHPAQAQAGLAYTGITNLVVEADYAWVGWNSFKDLPVTFAGPASALSRVLIEDYKNSNSIRLGLEYSLTPNMFRVDGWKIRAGFAGVSSAAPAESVTPLLPEQDRNYYNVGLGVPLSSSLIMDLGYGYIHTPGARGRIVERNNRTTTAAQVNSGVYNLSAHVFSLTLKASY